MDFDPRGSKWQCCCCSLPHGLQMLATGEMIISTLVAAIATYHLAKDKETPSYTELCLIVMMIVFALSSALLILGIHRHNAKLMYPTVVARMLLIVFIAAFGLTAVVSRQRQPLPVETLKQRDGGWDKKVEIHTGEPNLALRLVLMVFAMLFLAVILVYCSYLVIRCISYENAFARLKQRRNSLIQAGMIDPDFGSRRPSAS